MSFGKLGAMGRGMGHLGVLGNASIGLTYAPAIDQPIITSGSGLLSASAFSTQTSHTFKRIGDNTTAVDMANDTKFRYPGVPDGTLGPGTTNSLVIGTLMPGGTAQARRWDTQFEFVTSSKYVGMDWLTSSTVPRMIVVVNGKWISPSFTTTGVAGNNSYVLFEFPDRSSRKIKIITSGGGSQIRSIWTESANPPVKAASAGTLLVVDGDSMSAGSGTPPDYASAFDAWPQATATILGFDHCCNASIGGTKWVASGAGDVAVSHFGGGRLTTALTLTPDAFVYAGSRNDSAVDQTALDAITSAVETALDATTVTKKFVMGTFTVLSQNAAVQAGAEAKSVPFVNMTYGLQASDIGVDGVHPTYQGAVNLRNRIVPALRSAGCVP
jgi:hypothetical protein